MLTKYQAKADAPGVVQKAWGISMGEVISLVKRAQERNKKKVPEKVPEISAQPSGATKAPGTLMLPDAKTIKLWQFSLALDDLVRHEVVESTLPPEELATIVAHRLGTLIGCCEKSSELAQFCYEIIKKRIYPKACP